MRAWSREARADAWCGLLLLLLAVYVMREAVALELGTPTNPGSGFMIFGAGAALALLSLHQLVRALRTRRATAADAERAAPVRWGRILVVILVTIAYIVALRSVGYLVCTFVLLTVLFQALERGRWAARTAGAAVASLATYALFAKLLQLNLPKGLIWFF
jgi:putative tricarboxylic transport membrane protein